MFVAQFFKGIVQSPGYIFGPLMLLSGLFALVLCYRASAEGSRSAARRAALSAALPPILGVVGVLVGLIVWGLSGDTAPDRGIVWTALGYTVLFGVTVSILPAIWSAAMLLRRSGSRLTAS